MKTFFCFALFIAAATASVIPIGSPIGASISGPLSIGVAGISPLGLGVSQPLLINSQLGLGATKIIAGGLPLNAGLVGIGGLPLNAGLGLGSLQLGAPLGLGLGGQIISPLNGGLILKK